MPEPLNRSKELRADRRNLAERMREIVDAPEGTDGQMDPGQVEEFDRLHVEQNELGERIETIETEDAAHRDRVTAIADLEKTMKASRGVEAGKQDSDQLDRMNKDDDPGDQSEADEKYERAFDAYLRYGVSRMKSDAQDTLMTRMGDPVEAGDMPAEIRAQSVGADTGGGFFVPEGFHNRIISARVRFGGMRRARTTILPTNSGQDLPIPTDNDTSNSGAILSENTAETELDVVIGQVVLHAYMYTSKLVKVSRQLLQDSAFDINAWLADKLSTRIGRITNVHFTTGDGAAKPFGMTVQATSAVTAAATDDITIDELLDLKHAVDPDYREGAEWMFADALLKLLKQKKDGEGRPLWQSGIAVREPDTIDSDPYIINQQMPSLATTNKPIAYGDFSNYYIRDVMGVQLLRLEERYAEALQVAFLAFSRHDGVLVDAGSNPIKVITLA